jgi:hypothetical protein
MTNKLKPLTSMTTSNAVVKVEHGPDAMTLNDDKAFIVAPGGWKADIKRRGYSAGYLKMNEGPLLQPLGTREPISKTVLSQARQKTAPLSVVERFDAAFQEATGQTGTLTERYRREGYKTDAGGWEGFCERWSIMALDPDVGHKLNDARIYKGAYFSIADQRGLATFMGDQRVTYQDLFVGSPNVLDLHRGVISFIRPDGPGFIADRFNNEANRLANLQKTGVNAAWANQVWNQPFYAVEQSVADVDTKGLAEALTKLGKDELEPGYRVYRVKTKLTYGSEAHPDDNAPGGTPEMDHYEGPGQERYLNLDYFVLTNAAGEVLEGQLANGSDPLPDSFWVPNPTEGWKTPGGAFFRDLVEKGVEVTKVHHFEELVARLKAVGTPVTAEHKAMLKKEFAGVSAAYAKGELDSALAPLGLTARDFD